MSKLRSRLHVTLSLCAGPLLLLALSAPLPATAQPDPNKVLKLVADAVAAVSAEQHLGVDPHLVDSMAASASVFAGNYCYQSNPSVSDTHCDATLFNPAVLGSNVRRFISDTLSGSNEVVSLGARLANVSGGDFAQIGWPPAVKNDVGIITLDAGGATVERVILATPSGQMQIASEARQILMEAGQYTLTVRLSNGSETTKTVSVRPRQQVAFAASPAGQANTMAGPIDVPGGRFCYDKHYGQAGLTGTGPLAEFNWGRSQLQGGPGAFLAPIATKYAVDIQVDDKFGACHSRCQRAMGVVFSQAIAVWRAGCQRCNRNALAVLQVGDNVWIDSRLAGRLRSIASGVSATLDLTRPYPDEMLRVVAAPSLNIPTMAVPSYEYISSDRLLRSALCSRQASAAPWVPAAQSFLCSGTEVEGIIQPTVTLLGDATHCGSAHDFLACGRPDAGIELALGATQFVLSTPTGTMKIGHPETESEAPVDMLDVVLHEVGHWFGVPHLSNVGIDKGGDIMASTLGDGQQCVSATSLTMMNNAMDTRWSWRVTGQQGLRKPH